MTWGKTLQFLGWTLFAGVICGVIGISIWKLLKEQPAVEASDAGVVSSAPPAPAPVKPRVCYAATPAWSLDAKGGLFAKHTCMKGYLPSYTRVDLSAPDGPQVLFTGTCCATATP